MTKFIGLIRISWLASLLSYVFYLSLATIINVVHVNSIVSIIIIAIILLLIFSFLGYHIYKSIKEIFSNGKIRFSWLQKISLIFPIVYFFYLLINFKDLNFNLSEIVLVLGLFILGVLDGDEIYNNSWGNNEI